MKLNLSEVDKKSFAEAAAKYAGKPKSYKSSIAQYSMHKLKGNMPKAMQAYARSINEQGPLVMISWYEIPFLLDSEFSLLAPVVVEKMKENPDSARAISFSYRLAELAQKGEQDEE